MVFNLRFRVSPAKAPEAPKKKQMEPINETASAVLLSLDQMPNWFRHDSNEWILYGYRDISGSFQACLCSLLYIHNESVNIYSHLIPAVSSLLGQQYLASRYSGVTSADFTPVSIFMLTAVACLSLSTTYHTLMNHSKRMGQLCLQLDMLGVVIFVLGGLMLGIYMVFWCEPLLRNIYWSMSGAFGALTIFVIMHSEFQGPKYRLLRTLMFVATGLSGVVSLIHGINIFGMSQMMNKAFPYTLAKAGCLLLGTFFYVVTVLKTRFPESLYPGKFDLCGSHSIFHILVVCAFVVQLIGYLDAFDFANTNLTCSTLF
ncbi:ADIPOR-like receptor spbc12c2.09c [Fusarium oxysporum f. sp. cubense race 1]|uniref:ADIPOR-like receptor spbc12c2.09c n=1 Tax=Fusarium oxysporum f. sp. cubense (strain race 1) TaxID=1229664 RepID=N4U3Q7_FUSC1|nr:ADIPOR-like receptor spbc12c2.09c [Fusarium oxysporum f. sp. cubense race 1]